MPPRGNTGLKLVVGARLDLQDAPSLLCHPTDRAAYGRLCRLLTLGQQPGKKGLLHAVSGGSWPPMAKGKSLRRLPPDGSPVANTEFETALGRLRETLPGRLYLAAHHLYRGDDRARIAALAEPRQALWFAAGRRQRRPLSRNRRAVRSRTFSPASAKNAPIAEAGFRLQANAERHLKSPAEMARLFSGFEDALARTIEIAEACRFSLDELKYEYPEEPAPEGKTPQQHLEDLAWAGARSRYPEGVPDKVAHVLKHELALIRQLNYAPYFLTVHDIVTFARSRGAFSARGAARRPTRRSASALG